MSASGSNLLSPRRAADWSALVPEGSLGDVWHVPPEWLDALQDDLDERSRREVSRFVLAGIHSACAHAERRFVAAAADARAHEHVPFLLQLITEESEHADAFAAFAEAACGGLLPDRIVVLGVPAADARALLLLRLLVAEEIVDALDLALARDERVHPAVRALHAAHHADEARHLAVGRSASAALVASASEPEALRRELSASVAASWRAAFPVEALRRAGLPHPAAARDAMWNAAPLADLRLKAETRRFDALRRRGVLA